MCPCNIRYTNLTVKDDHVNNSIFRCSFLFFFFVVLWHCPSKLLLNSWRSHVHHPHPIYIHVYTCLLCLHKWQKNFQIDFWMLSLRRKNFSFFTCWFNIWTDYGAITKEYCCVIQMNNIDISKVVVIVYLRLYSTVKKLPDIIVFKEKLFPHHIITCLNTC